MTTQNPAQVVSDWKLRLRDELRMSAMKTTFTFTRDEVIDLMGETAISIMSTRQLQQAQPADVWESYKTWPADIRAKLSCHDLRRMSGWAAKSPIADWRIDTSAGGPILVYQNCSVIESEQAQYVLNLIAQDQQAELQQAQDGVELVAKSAIIPPPTTEV